MIAPWAAHEMAEADFGDERLDARAVSVFSVMGQRPNLSIPAACGGRAGMTAAYRFFDNEKVTFEKVLEPHRQRTRQRVAEQSVALLVQDTTEIDLTRPEQPVTGAGELDGSRRGLLLHAMQAFTTDGTPLGMVWAEVLNRPERVSSESAAEKRQRLKETPIEPKESLPVAHGAAGSAEVGRECAGRVLRLHRGQRGGYLRVVCRAARRAGASLVDSRLP